MSCLLEQRGDSLAEQRVVVGHDDTQDVRGIPGCSPVGGCKVA
jgi:hypothetical protein